MPNRERSVEELVGASCWLSSHFLPGVDVLSRPWAHDRNVLSTLVARMPSLRRLPGAEARKGYVAYPLITVDRYSMLLALDQSPEILASRFPTGSYRPLRSRRSRNHERLEQIPKERPVRSYRWAWFCPAFHFLNSPSRPRCARPPTCRRAS
jgi:hypothetical protein